MEAIPLLAILVAALVIAVLAVLMPVFVYQIRNDIRRMRIAAERSAGIARR